MRIEVWADVVCPWCYIGKRRLEKALAGFGHGEEVEVVWRSYELDPFAPEHGTESTVQVLARKWGTDEAGARRAMERGDEVARTEGLELRHHDAPHARTLTAHRLLHLARAHGRQHQLLEELLASYFTRGESLGDHDVLRRAAAAAGLDAASVEDVLSGTAYRDAVLEDVAQARAYGAGGVPFFVVDGRFGISGAQPVELLEDALQQAWAARSRA